jgi:hypothetical protein
MATLHIEHAISDLDTWRGAFKHAEGLRAKHGVRGYDVRHPVDDPSYLLIDLTFDSTDAAESFLVELRKIWKSPTAAPALVGAPQTKILESVSV